MPALTLCQIARKAIESFFSGKEFVPDDETRKKFSEKRACFVTLTKRGSLRGCIGNLHAEKPLWKAVIDNAINAAFNDIRFPPLRKDELGNIKIEVSVLSTPERLEFETPEELLKKINRNMGIILKSGMHEAAFLPQVWKHFESELSAKNQEKDKIRFLEELSLKAGLNKDAWKTADVWFYYVDVEEEG